MVVMKVSERVVIMAFILKEDISCCSPKRKPHGRNCKKWFINICMLPWRAAEILKTKKQTNKKLLEILGRFAVKQIWTQKSYNLR